MCIDSVSLISFHTTGKDNVPHNVLAAGLPKVVNSWFITQGENVYQQLMAGCRFVCADFVINILWFGTRKLIGENKFDFLLNRQQKSLSYTKPNQGQIVHVGPLTHSRFD